MPDPVTPSTGVHHADSPAVASSRVEAIPSSAQGGGPASGRDGAPARCMVLTISDSRTLETDQGGGYLARQLSGQGYTVLARRIVADETAAIRARVLDAVESGDIDVLVLTGGTGIGARDVTPDAVLPLFSKRLPGFGEVFRQMCFARLGADALLTRADAGVITRVLVFILPGRPEACKLAMDELITPAMAPALAQLCRRRAPV